MSLEAVVDGGIRWEEACLPGSAGDLSQLQEVVGGANHCPLASNLIEAT